MAYSAKAASHAAAARYGSLARGSACGVAANPINVKREAGFKAIIWRCWERRSASCAWADPCHPSQPMRKRCAPAGRRPTPSRAVKAIELHRHLRSAGDASAVRRRRIRPEKPGCYQQPRLPPTPAAVAPSQPMNNANQSKSRWRGRAIGAAWTATSAVADHGLGPRRFGHGDFAWQFAAVGHFLRQRGCHCRSGVCTVRRRSTNASADGTGARVGLKSPLRAGADSASGNATA